MTEVLNALVTTPLLFKGTFFFLATATVLFLGLGVLHLSASDEGIGEE